MKKCILWGTILISASSMAMASPFLALGDGAELFLTGTGKVKFDDNVLSSPTKISDTIFVLSPGLEVTTGKNSQISTLLDCSEDVTRYDKTTSLNTNLAHVTFGANYLASKSTVMINAGYNQNNQNTPTGTTVPGSIGAGLLRSNETNAGISGETDLTQKTRVGLGFTYDKTHYVNNPAGTVDDKIYTVPIDFYYEYTQKLSLLAGLRYRDTELAGLPGYKDYYYSVGARGDFTALISGTLGLGINERTTPGLANQSSFGLNSSLTYKASEKTKITLNLNDDTGASSNGQSQEIISFSSRVDTDFDNAWKGFASVTYNNTKYKNAVPSRTDNYYEGDIGFTYVFSLKFNVTGTYSYKKNDSNAVAQSFNDNLISLAAVVRY